MNSLLDTLFFILGWGYVFLAPYTKVEESFNMQATHDVLMFGVTREALRNFDHFVFSGPVPRTFIGSILLAWASTPFITVASWLDVISSKADLQIVVRLMLATWNALALCFLRRAASNRFGRSTGLFFVVLTCSQFHLLFWMSRTLPNMFALPLVNIALALLIDRGRKVVSSTSEWCACWLLGVTTVIFRIELLLLWASIFLQLLTQRQISIVSLVKTNFSAGLVGGAISFLIDSYFWQKPVLPEINSFLFNVAQGQSSNWGVSPFYVYFTVHLPKLLMTALPLSLVGALVDRRISSLLLPYMGFIALISNLGHKEWRFIIYAVPAFNVAAARGLVYLMTRKKTTLRGQLGLLIAIGSILLNMLLTLLLLRTSVINYPGGDAIAELHRLLANNTTVLPHVHICNLAAQSGVTLFQHLNAPPFHPSLSKLPTNLNGTWVYNKTETLIIADLSSSLQITHLISEIPPNHEEISKDWKVMKAIPAFDGLTFNKGMLKERGAMFRKPWNLLQLEQDEKLWIYQRT